MTIIVKLIQPPTPRFEPPTFGFRGDDANHWTNDACTSHHLILVHFHKLPFRWPGNQPGDVRYIPYNIIILSFKF